MQAEAELGAVLIATKLLVDGLHVGHELQRLGGGNLTNTAAEGGEGAVDNFRVVANRDGPPYDEESVANVLVGLSAIVVARLVNDLADGVGEKHHLILQALDRVGKLANVAEAICTILLLAAKHKVQTRLLLVGEIGGDNLVTCTSEAELHQADNLREGNANSLGLVLGLRLPLELIVGVLGELLDETHHGFNRLHDHRGHVRGERRVHDEDDDDQ
mmetsp:Transcript_12575/g.25290  ORF Transcript_12575/g.25290 Transcript_12575/m.25290 type:complete len:216 (-) Transcript_12575:1242-1889(-)